ncbi:MAG: nucleotide sugar dehydrogenase [Candidatus Acetothermia bacterium]|jgi:UDP-N-acetyl-D-glucosamine dehydrogenase|nr:nucleotide sugar dehydrogenase [Candidatus Acetothermia bacterium]MDH7505865.1 nucleotide sugar dehydrogenase [Candidatus Acetothermia bacterium]
MSDQTSVGIVGLGYVGLPLAIEFCRSGFSVYGIDRAPEKIELLRKGRSYVGDISEAALQRCLNDGTFHVSSDYDLLAKVEAISICVPTPLRKTKDPDMSYVIDAAESIARVLQRGQVIILESTVYPGATEELIAPILEQSGLKVGRDFYLAFSPERVDPGNKQYGIREIPKIVGGVTEGCTKRAVELYARVFRQVIPMGSAREAEMAKLLENTFRAVNIGLINELALVANRMGINIWNVIEAAQTKPFGFMAFYPGPGLGGHCIPIDPFYLSWKAKTYRADTSFIDLADKVNSQMPSYVVERVADLLNQQGKPLKGSKILILGVAYKRDVNDIRESPALDIIGLLLQKGAEVAYNDPHVPRLEYLNREWRSQELNERLLASQDCVLIVADHSSYNWEFIAKNAKLIFDTRNATKGIRGKYRNVYLL